MPYLKPGTALAIQEQLVELMEEFNTIEDMYKKGQLNKETLQFLQMDPVTGNYDSEAVFVKANGVYVNLESVLDAEKQRLPIKRIQE